MDCEDKQSQVYSSGYNDCIDSLSGCDDTADSKVTNHKKVKYSPKSQPACNDKADSKVSQKLKAFQYLLLLG